MIPQDDDRRALAGGLTGLLADTYVLSNSTRLFQWNVEGPQFLGLHGMFREQYLELSRAVDRIAERIRVLGFYTPGTLQELAKISRQTQEPGVREPDRMLSHLAEGHQQVAHRIRDLRQVAERTMDEATADLLVERLRVHEKAFWVLRTQQAGGGSQDLDFGVRPRALSG